MTDVLPDLTERTPATLSTLVAPTPRRRTRRTLTAVDLVVVGVVTYAVAAALNASDLQRLARRQPLGVHREFVVSLADSTRSASHTIGLDQPGRLIERLRGIPDPSATSMPVRSTTAPTTSAPSTTIATTTTTYAATTGFDAAFASMPAMSTTSPTTTIPATTTTTQAPVPLVSPDAPVAFWYGGDSLSQGMGRSLERFAPTDHGSTVAGKGVISTGLARPDVFDWASAIGLAVSQTKLNVAVVFLGANDTQDVVTDTGTAAFGSPEWAVEYRSRVAELMTQADLGSVHLIWVGLPPVRQGSLEKQLRVIDDIFRSEAARHKNTVYLDLRAIFGTADGGYDPYCHDEGSSQVLCRSNDGVHFTDTGYDRLAHLVMKSARLITA